MSLLINSTVKSTKICIVRSLLRFWPHSIKYNERKSFSIIQQTEHHIISIFNSNIKFSMVNHAEQYQKKRANVECKSFWNWYQEHLSYFNLPSDRQNGFRNDENGRSQFGLTEPNLERFDRLVRPHYRQAGGPARTLAAPRKLELFEID
jgi:hypothetical protein